MKYLKHVTILLSMYQVLKDTKGMLNKEKFALMKDGARLLNFARGDLVVNEDLLEAVETGKLSKYITDFAAQELLEKIILLYYHTQERLLLKVKITVQEWQFKN